MITIVPATPADAGTLDNLMQLYAHDWSELLALEVGDDGRFQAYTLAPFFDEDARDRGRHAFIIRADDRVAGFALVTAFSRLTGTPGVFDMAEFFVLRRYRRKGVGAAAAAALFERYRGPWEIRQRDENPNATAFWRRVIAAHTAGRFEETRWSDAAWTGPVQRFTTAPA